MFLIFIILGGLFSLNFFINLIFRDAQHYSWKSILFSGLICCIYLIYMASPLISLIISTGLIDKISNYTIIPLYFFFHILITLIISIILILFLLLPKILLDEYSGMLSLLNPSTYLNLNLPRFISHFLHKINIYFNPIYSIDFSSINNKFILKSIFLVSYLISGISLLSPLTNHLISSGITANMSHFTKDCDLYKSVFLISLIPFILKYILNFENITKKD